MEKVFFCDLQKVKEFEKTLFKQKIFNKLHHFANRNELNRKIIFFNE